MASQVTNYKCPSCGGPLRFDEALGKLQCDFCGSIFTTEEVEAMFAEADKAAEEAKEKEYSSEGLDPDLRAYSCPSCGAELVMDSTTAAGSCPYCANPTIVPKTLEGEFKPDYIIPFKYDKKAAMDALNAHYKGKKLLPKVFADQNHIEEIKGVYVPFWLYSGTAYGDADFNGERVYSQRQGREEVITTEHYRLHRSGDVDFVRIPVDGSTKMPDAHMDSIEPFNYAELKPFSKAYLPGFMAEVYDVDAQQASERSEYRLRRSVIEGLEESCRGYGTVTPIGSPDVRMDVHDVEYAMLPVWMLATRWKDQTYLFAMNGQTGKLIGDLPVDKGRFWVQTALTFGAVFAAIAAAGFFLM
jgi:DNA-directed RNA polymerase subunit RPC12/RpoP